MNASKTRLRMCVDCRVVQQISVHKTQCKPCYNAWHTLYRLERKAKRSEEQK